MYKDKKYYIKKVTGGGGYSLYKNGKTIWFSDTNETSFAASETGEYAIRYSAGAGSTVKTTFKLSIYEMSGQEWLQGKKSIPSVEYPSEISTVKDNIKIIIDNDNSEQKEYNLVVQQEMLQGDYFDLEREKEVHHFNKFIVTSSEGDWIETSDIKKRYVLFTNKVKSSLSNINQCCSHNKNCNQWAITEDSFQVRNNGLYFRNSNITNKEEFNKFVAKQEEAGTPINFYYECEKYELDLTEEQKETLNQLNNLELFKGVNNIYTEQDLALLQLNYTADTKMYIDNKISSQKKEG